MARRKAGSHPALASQALRRSLLLEEDAGAMARLQGWSTFSPVQKQFLAVYPWFGTMEESQRYLGLSVGWASESGRKNPLFREAVKQRGQVTERIIKGIAADLLGLSFVRLYDFLAKDFPDKRLQLDAIKHLHKIQGMSPEERPPQGIGNIINARNVNMFMPQEKKVPALTERQWREMEQAKVEEMERTGEPVLALPSGEQDDDQEE